MIEVYRQTSTVSWLNRIGRSMKGILLGCLLAIASIPLLWWNEGRAIDRTHTLQAGQRAVVSVTADRVDPANDDRLIHLSGLATTDDILTDGLFGVSVKALRLRRAVEMYQWEEEKRTSTSRNTGGSESTETTYRYDKRWLDHWVDSGTFEYHDGHTNPATMPFESETSQASHVTLGAFRLGQAFADQIDAYRPYPVPETSQAPAGFKPHGAGYYRGTPSDPQIGDIRVRFEVVEPTTVSVVGRQFQGGVEIAHMPKGTIALLDLGRIDASTLFAKAEDANRAMTWGIRILGLVLMWLGLKLILSPLRVLADVVPLIGSLVGAGTSLMAALIAISLGFVTIAAAWVFYRPMLAGILIGIAVILVGVGILRMRRAQPVPAGAGG